MILPMLILLAALHQQPVAQRAGPAPAQQGAGFDSARAIVSAVGLRVAEVRSAHEQFRRAVFNASDAEVLNAAGVFRERCRSLDSAAVSGARRMCRSCGSRQVRTALEGYREALPSVSRVGAECAARLLRLSRGNAAAGRLRHEVFAVGNLIVQGLLPYERRLAVLREAAGWAPPRPVRQAPRR